MSELKQSVDTTRLIKLYAEGKTIKQISEICGLSTGKVYNDLKKSGCTFRKKGYFGPHPPEVKKKISDALKGRVISAETRAKISAAQSCHYNGLNGYGYTKKHNGGYVLAYVPDHPKAHKDGFVQLHTVIMERVLGRYLFDYEEVHHINRKRDDNRPENLRVMKRREHRALHMKEKNTRRNDLLTR